MDYKNGKIYRVVCSETDRQYIGSTCSTLVKRLYGHKLKHNRASCKDFIDPKIFLIEDFPCDRKDQLLSRERFYMESMECVNMIRPIVTKEEKKQKIKEYREKNKEQLNQKYKEWCEKNAEKLKIQKKEWNENNKDKIKKIADKYRENNKERRTQKFDCECGGTYSYTDKARHKKTKKHQAYLSSIV